MNKFFMYSSDIRSLSIHKNLIFSAFIDGTIIINCCECLINNDESQKNTNNIHKLQFGSLSSIHSNEYYLFIGSSQGILTIYNMDKISKTIICSCNDNTDDKLEPFTYLYNHSSNITKILTIKDSIVTTSWDTYLKIQSIENLIYEYKHPRGIWDCATNDSFIITACIDGFLRIFSITNSIECVNQVSLLGNCLRVINWLHNEIVCISNDGKVSIHSTQVDSDHSITKLDQNTPQFIISHKNLQSLIDLNVLTYACVQYKDYNIILSDKMIYILRRGDFHRKIDLPVFAWCIGSYKNFIFIGGSDGNLYYNNIDEYIFSDNLYHSDVNKQNPSLDNKNYKIQDNHIYQMINNEWKCLGELLGTSIKFKDIPDIKKKFSFKITHPSRGNIDIEFKLTDNLDERIKEISEEDFDEIKQFTLKNYPILGGNKFMGINDKIWNYLKCHTLKESTSFNQIENIMSNILKNGQCGCCEWNERLKNNIPIMDLYRYLSLKEIPLNFAKILKLHCENEKVISVYNMIVCNLIMRGFDLREYGFEGGSEFVEHALQSNKEIIGKIVQKNKFDD